MRSRFLYQLMLPVNPDLSNAETNTASSLSLMIGSSQRRFGLCDVDHHHSRLRRDDWQILAVHVAKELEGIVIQHGVGNAWLPVEVHEVEVATEDLFHHVDPGLLAALLVRQRQVDHCVDPVGVQQGAMPQTTFAPQS